MKSQHRHSLRTAHVLFWYVISTLATTSALFGQPEKIHFERLSLEEGLTSYVITSLNRDSRGFLWVGTRRGLNCYHGDRFKSYKTPILESGYKDYPITAVVEDKSVPSHIWVGTEQGGLVKYDSRLDSVSAFIPCRVSGTPSTIKAIYFDSSGDLWFATERVGLHHFSVIDSNCRHYNLPQELPNGSESKEIQVLFNSASTPDNLWLGTRSGLLTFNLVTKEFSTLPNTPLALADSSIIDLAETKDHIWIGMKDGTLYSYHLETSKFKKFNQLFYGKSFKEISTIIASKTFPGILWIGTRGQGLIAFNTLTEATQHYTYIANDVNSLSRNDVLSVIEDDSGLLWVGTVLGLNKAYLKPRRFEPVLLDPAIAELSNGPSVGTLYEAKSDPNIVWISVLREGIRRYNRKTGQVEEYLAHASLEVIFAMHEDQFDNFWLGGQHATLFQLDRDTRTLTSYPFEAVSSPLITQIYEAPSMPGYLWISTRKSGLYKFEISERKMVKHYTTANGLSGNSIWSVYEPADAPGKLWAISRNSGLSLIDTQSDHIQIFNKSSGASLPSDEILAIHKGSDGPLWLGTYNAGLIQFDPMANTCVTYTTEHGLPHNDVSAIMSDNQGRLWLSTSNGLSLFDPNYKIFTNFSVDDGLQGEIFHYQAWQQNSRGEILVGGSNGINIFNPDSIQIDTNEPNIVVTDILVDGKPYDLHRTEEGFPPIELDYRQNDIAFSFASLSFINPDKNRYKFMLQESDQNWKNIGTQQFQRFPSLSPGTYTFRVTGSNSDGYWNATGASIQFEILPPFWLKWWFLPVVVLIAALFVAAFYQYRLFQLKRLENTRKRIADDLHDDIGSKMSSIALMLDRFGHDLQLQGKEKAQISEISNTARGFVDDLRDVIWLVDSDNDDLASLMIRIRQVTTQMLGGQNYTFQAPEKLPSMVLTMEQRRHMFLMYKEMIHNIMRHANASHVGIQFSCENGMLSFYIQDDGIGFDPSSVQNGRGLKNLKKRADSLKGNLEIQSSPGKGTLQEFNVKIV